MDYWIKGDTYPARKELKSWGCLWVPGKRMWKVKGIDSEDIIYKEIKSCGYDLIPVELKPECQKIQDILNKKSRGINDPALNVKEHK